ncbi:MAG: FHA domain-containing protein [Acidimicrobiales bacterium]
MVTCQHCEHVNQVDARYCSSCGRPLIEPVEETTGSIPTIDPAADAREEQLARLMSELPKGIGCLVVRNGEQNGSWFSLSGEITRIGRHPESDVFLDDITVSRRHAEIAVLDEHFTVRDVGSLNGTYVNRVRTDQSELRPGDEIQIGKYRFLFAYYGEGAS